MEFEWDPAKNESNQQKHGFGFRYAAQVLKGPRVIFPSHQEDEERWGVIGILNDLYVVVIYTMRGAKYRIISSQKGPTR